MLTRQLRWFLVIFTICFSGWTTATPYDVNGDSIVGPEEAIDLSTSWKGPAQLLTATQPWQVSGETIYYNSGNVGIGDATPQFKLDVRAASGLGARFGMQGAGGGSLVIASNPGDNRVYLEGFNSSDDGNATEMLLTGYSGGFIPKITLRSSVTSVEGNLAVGEPFPSGRIHSRSSGVAIRGDSTGSTGVHATAVGGYGIYGLSTGAIGIYGQSNATASAGMYGVSPYIGVEGITTSGSSDGGRQGVRGDNFGSASGWAGYFYGNLGCSGTLTKGAGSFKIDHPLDPENKYLSHSFVESPDMMNVYNGNVVLDENGEAEVVMPDWFTPLNKDFRYQLTSIGGPGPNLYIAKEMEEGVFSIAGGSAGLKVSWQVTGLRQDVYANARRIQVEEDKPEGEKGYYLYPEYYGKSKEESIPARMGVKTK